ncbi:hypothetical protein [Methanolobus sp. WCC4]|uniref:hypothetical protein n=1 Tax=Methanolobus sp. WCC4 TaxID=3125784 RepID=UPI0030FBE8A3
MVNKETETVDKTGNKTTEQPVNNRKLEETEKVDGPEVTFDAHSTAVQNLALMGQATRDKLDVMLGSIDRNLDSFGSEKNDGSFFPYAPPKLGIGLNMRAGNFKTGEKDKEGKDIYKPHVALPANITFTDPNDWKKSISINILQLIKLNNYITKVLEANRTAVSYYVALQKEIEQRELDEDVGY